MWLRFRLFSFCAVSCWIAFTFLHSFVGTVVSSVACFRYFCFCQIESLLAGVPSQELAFCEGAQLPPIFYLLAKRMLVHELSVHRKLDGSTLDKPVELCEAQTLKPKPYTFQRPVAAYP